MDRLDIQLESLLTNDRFVRGVARGLITDAATVDDVVQDTWWAAITRRPDSDRPLLPWLATVARNFALKARRGEMRRHNREIGAAIPEVCIDAALASAPARIRATLSHLVAI